MTAPHGRSTGGGTVPRWTPGPGDWVVDPGLPADPPPAVPTPRRRRGLLIGAAVLAVAATAAGVVTYRALASEPESPLGTAEAFFGAEQRHDWLASWDLLCHSEQRAVGSLERWISVKEATVATPGQDYADVTVIVSGARLRPGSAPPSYLVDFWVGDGADMHPQQMLVVEEDGGLRVCDE